MKDEVLSDWGEFRLLREVVLPALKGAAVSEGLGDDASSSTWPNSEQDLVVTSDLATIPLVSYLGNRDPHIHGWYAVHINASDLAASGAAPFIFTSSVEAPPDMLVADFKRFFQGMASACEAFGLRNGGGSINTGRTFSCHGTAIGTVGNGKKIRRSGCKRECLIVSIGECGLFAAAYLQALRGGLDSLASELRERMEKPVARLQEMLTLNSNDLIAAASDCSDGVLGTLWNICEASGCRIVVDMDDDKLPELVSKEAQLANLNPWNLMFFWGDWQVVCAVRPEDWTRFERVSFEERIPYVVLGTAEAGRPALFGTKHGMRRPLRILRNESFSVADYSCHGAQNVEYLLKAELFDFPERKPDEVEEK
jgi:thiamine-monophosphate kinase